MRAYVSCLEVQKQKLGITFGDGTTSKDVGVSGGGNTAVMMQQLCMLSQRLPVCLWRGDVLGSAE